MLFRKYEKIHRLGKEETLGILDGTCYIEEKIDGANLSVWLGDDGEIHVGSRNNDLTKNGNEFNGAVKYCNEHEGIKALLNEFPDLRLYGEWLVKHTINYNPTALKKFYLFDVYSHDLELFFNTEAVHALGEKYKIDCVPFLGKLVDPTEEDLKKLITKSAIGDTQEGIVIKNPWFKNEFGEMCYAKIVSESFKEDNGVVFGGNNKHSDCYWEMYIVNKYIDVARVEKIMNKLQPEINEKLDMKHIPRIVHTVYHDMLTEEIWEISKKAVSINFKILERIAIKKARQVYVDILTNTISVADQ